MTPETDRPANDDTVVVQALEKGEAHSQLTVRPHQVWQAVI